MKIMTLILALLFSFNLFASGAVFKAKVNVCENDSVKFVSNEIIDFKNVHNSSDLLQVLTFEGDEDNQAFVRINTSMSTSDYKTVMVTYNPVGCGCGDSYLFIIKVKTIECISYREVDQIKTNLMQASTMLRNSNPNMMTIQSILQDTQMDLNRIVMVESENNPEADFISDLRRVQDELMEGLSLVYANLPQQAQRPIDEALYYFTKDYYGVVLDRGRLPQEFELPTEAP